MPTTIDSAGITFNDTTSLTSANIGTAQLVNGSVTAAKLGTTEQTRIAKAWVNFDGTTSPGTIRSSYNVSSITKNSTGNYTVNFTTAMSDANFSVSGIYYTSGTAVSVMQAYNYTTAQVQILMYNGAAAIIDGNPISIQVFGN
jgi:hypothetical protein